MNFPLYIAKRYLLSKSSQNAVNIINMVTFFVTVVGAASLFIVLSGFAGLKTFSLSFANNFDPDLKVLPKEGKFFSFSSDDEASIKKIDGIQAFSTEIEERVFIAYKQKNFVAYIKGVDSRYNSVTNIDSLIYFGSWLGNFPDQVVPGIGIGNALGIAVNDRLNPITILAPKPGKGSISSQTKPYNDILVNASGVYAINEELDKKYVFANLNIVQELLGKKNGEITGINIKTNTGTNPEHLKEDLEKAFSTPVRVKTRAQLNDSLYKMLNTENFAIYLIFTLVLIIALFNVVGAIIMMVIDKHANLKTLYSLGATLKNLRHIYFYQGLLLTALGGVIGVLLGSTLTWSQQQFGWLKITPSLPYPMEFTLVNVLVVLATIGVLGLIASKIASSAITKKLLG